MGYLGHLREGGVEILDQLAIHLVAEDAQPSFLFSANVEAATYERLDHLPARRRGSDVVHQLDLVLVSDFCLRHGSGYCQRKKAVR